MLKNFFSYQKRLFSKTKQLFYVGSTDILPEPLTREKEQYYLELKAEGDIEAKNKLIEHNLRLVVFLSRKYENTNADGNELHLEDVLGTEPDIVTRDLDAEVEKQMLIKEIEKLDERDKKIMILRYGLEGQEEKTQKDVATLLGISQSYISRIEKKVIRRLKVVVKT